MDPVAIGPRGPRVPRPKPLLRNILGDVLRRTRLAQGRTLADVARTARVSMPYLSELERGRKEASSEILAAICEALHIGLSDLLAEIQRSLGAERAPVVPLDAVRSARISAPVHQPSDVHSASPGGQAVPGPSDVTCLLAA
jgi:transcriptional regulator with XRE-family HTH domain